MPHPTRRSRAMVFGCLSGLWLLAMPWPGQAQQPSEEPAWTEVERRMGDGEQCLVCRLPIHGEEVVVLRYRGRTFAVKSEMLRSFADDPETYFAQLEAHSGLFDEHAVGGGRVSRGWLFLGAYIVLGLVFGALCGSLAIHRALAPLPWFFAGLVGNVAALFVLLISPRGDPAALPAGVGSGLGKTPLTRTPRACSGCGRPNHPAAQRCSACGTTLVPSVEAEIPHH